MTDAPILYTWNGEAMVPLARFHNRVNADFTVGEVYRMTAAEERSLVSHRHYFAQLHEIWMNLPDELAAQFPSSEHLRKHCLCMTGFRNERKLVASSVAEARKIAAWIRPRDEYAIVSTAENVVVEWTAQSQSTKAMGKARFQESKTKVLDFASEMIGLPPAAHGSEAA